MQINAFFINLLNSVEHVVQLILSNQNGFESMNLLYIVYKSNRKTMDRNWNNQKPNPALKTKMGNK